MTLPDGDSIQQDASCTWLMFWDEGFNFIWMKNGMTPDPIPAAVIEMAIGLWRRGYSGTEAYNIVRVDYFHLRSNNGKHF